MEVVADNPKHKSHKQKKIYLFCLKGHCLQEAYVGIKIDLSPQITTRVSLRLPLICPSHQSRTPPSMWNAHKKWTQELVLRGAAGVLPQGCLGITQHTQQVF